MDWFFFAILSATAAALTAILAKIGVEGVPSTLATAIRTVIVLVFVWLMVLGFREQRALYSISRRSVVFLLLSGLGTGISWLAYVRALQIGPASRVGPDRQAQSAIDDRSRSTVARWGHDGAPDCRRCPHDVGALLTIA